MNRTVKFSLFFCLSILMVSCVSKKRFNALQADFDAQSATLSAAKSDLSDCSDNLTKCEQDKEKLDIQLKNAQDNLNTSEQRIADLKDQIADMIAQREKQLQQIEGLTTLSQSATKNISETLAQLEQKEEYIGMLRSAKSRTDSINLALAVNLKGALSDGIADNDVEVSVDKTVVMVNLSDKMLYRSGRASLSTRAKEILSKIAKIIESRPDLQVMVEGYTDSDPISTGCIKDNWDLSVKRATAVVRVLQDDYKVDPNKLIAAGRGEYNAIASNETKEGRSLNRRTRIIIMPKLDQFYDLLGPDGAE